MPDCTITASGWVTVARQTQLAVAAVGQVITLTVAKSDHVQAGQVLATLAGADRLAAVVAAADTQVLAAQQALKDLQDNAALAGAQAHLAVAQAQLAVAQAQTALTKANKDLHNVQNPARPARGRAHRPGPPAS